MKKIYLLSGPGKTNGFSKEIKEYLKKDLNGLKTITFIASSPDDYKKNNLYVFGNGDDVIGIYNHLLDMFVPRTVNIIDNRTKSKTGRKIIKSSDIVYLLGGDPNEQIKFLKRKKYDKELLGFNGVIFGTSAGAMNLSKSAYYSKDDEVLNSYFYEGIGLVDITIDPHFDFNNKEQLNEAKKNSLKHEIIGLPNDSAIRITQNKTDYINKCYKFKNEKMEEIN